MVTVEIDKLNIKLNDNIQELKSVTGVDDKTFREELRKVKQQIEVTECDFEDKINSLKHRIEKSIEMGALAKIQDLTDKMNQTTEKFDEIEKLVINHEDMIKNIGQNNSSRGEKNKNLTLNTKSNNALTPHKEKDSATINFVTMEDEKTIEQVDEKMFVSIEHPLSENQMLHNDNSSHTDINTEFISGKMDKIIGQDLSLFRADLSRLNTLVKRIEMMVQHNSIELENHSKKLIMFMRSGKSNISTQDQLISNIKTDIRRGAHMSMTSKKLSMFVPNLKEMGNPLSPLKSLNTQIGSSKKAPIVENSVCCEIFMFYRCLKIQKIPRYLSLKDIWGTVRFMILVIKNLKTHLK